MRHMEKQTDVETERRKNRQKMDGQIDAWMDGQKDRHVRDR